MSLRSNQIYAGPGTTGSPGFAFTDGADTGFYHAGGANQIGVSVNGGLSSIFLTNGISLNNGNLSGSRVIDFSSDDNTSRLVFGTADDVWVYRPNVANVLQIDSDGAGGHASLYVNNVQPISGNAFTLSNASGATALTISTSNIVTLNSGDLRGPDSGTFTIRPGAGQALAFEDEGGSTSFTVGTVGQVSFTGNNVEIADNISLQFGASADARFRWSTLQASGHAFMVTTTLSGTAAQSGNIIVTTNANVNKDHDHGFSSNPKIYLHSATDPDVDNTEWMSFEHQAGNQATLDTGTGNAWVIRIGGANMLFSSFGNNNQWSRGHYAPTIYQTDNAGVFSWSSDGTTTGTADTQLYRAGVSVLGLQDPSNTTNTEFRIYDAAGTQYGFIRATGTTMELGDDGTVALTLTFNEATFSGAANGNGNALQGWNRSVEANTGTSASPHALNVTSDNLRIFTNEGATEANYHTLPTASTGRNYSFVVQDADGIRVTAAAADTIRIGTDVSAAAGYVSSTEIGASITLVAINATEWVATDVVGNWTVDGVAAGQSTIFDEIILDSANQDVTLTRSAESILRVANSAGTADPTIVIYDADASLGGGLQCPGTSSTLVVVSDAGTPNVGSRIVSYTHVAGSTNRNRPIFDYTGLYLEPTGVVAWDDTVNSGVGNNDLALARDQAGGLKIHDPDTVVESGLSLWSSDGLTDVWLTYGGDGLLEIGATKGARDGLLVLSQVTTTSLFSNTGSALTLQPASGQTINFNEDGGSTAMQVMTSGEVQIQNLYIRSSIPSGTIVGHLSGATGFALNDAGLLEWSSTGGATGTPDTGLARSSPGILRVSDGSTGFGGIVRNQFFYLSATNHATNTHGSGLTDSVIASNPATNVFVVDTTGRAMGHVTAATTGSEAGWYTTNDPIPLDADPYFLGQFSLTDTTDIRWVYGIVDTSGTLTSEVSADDPGNGFLGIAFDTNQSDTNFMFVEHNGTTQTRTSTGVAVDTNVHYVEIDVSSDGTAATIRLLDSAGVEEASRTVSAVPATKNCRVVFGHEALANAAKQTNHYHTQGYLRP